jgi:hypothetical protein
MRKEHTELGSDCVELIKLSRLGRKVTSLYCGTERNFVSLCDNFLTSEILVDFKD